MMNNLKCIAGLTFLIFQLKKSSILMKDIDGCKVEKDNNGIIVADCRATRIESIPQKLGANIDILDISDNNNTLTVLNQDDLKNYPKLWGLVMTNLSVTHFPAGFFQYSSLLRMLNISNTQIENLVEIPPSIKTLNFSYSNFEYMNLSHLINLEELFVRCSPNMKTVPHMQKTAPLEVIDVKFCPLTEGSYTQIAPFCHLHYFGLSSDVLTEANYTYQCCEFRMWLKTYRIKYGWQLQHCSQELYSDCGKVPIKFTKESVAAYKNCNASLRKKIVSKVLIVFVILLVAVVLIGFFLLFWYRRKLRSRNVNLQKNALQENSTKRKQSRSQPTTLPAELTTALPAELPTASPAKRALSPPQTTS